MTTKLLRDMIDRGIELGEMGVTLDDLAHIINALKNYESVRVQFYPSGDYDFWIDENKD